MVVSRSLKSVGPNATLVEDDLEGVIRALKVERTGFSRAVGSSARPSATSSSLADRSPGAGLQDHFRRDNGPVMAYPSDHDAPRAAGHNGRDDRRLQTNCSCLISEAQ
jgi:hypothetical protein